MRSLRKSLMAVLCLSPLMLAACEGWVPVYSHDIFPYGNDRTAGSGVVWVRESLLPPKTLKVEIPEEVVETLPALDPAPEPALIVEKEEELPPIAESDLVHDKFMDAQAK